MRTLLVLSFLFFAITLSAQPDREAILKPINQLFEGMKDADSAKVHRAFALNSNFDIVISGSNDKPLIKVKLQDFINNMGTPRKEKLNEVMWNEVVQQDRGFAQVWANYAFYRGNTFSHCGIDAFQLVRIGEDWKIVNLGYSVAKAGCNIPKEIADKFK